REERTAKSIPIDEQNDPNKTGIIGEEFTKLTTTLGNLSAKRTSANPDFAALMVKYFKQAGLKSGDVIAVGSSGSFPGLIVATLSACKAMEITPLLIYSIGASEYGATISEFTFIDMLEKLNIKKIIPYHLLAVSMGGNNDQAEAMLYPDSKKLIRNIARKSDAIFIDTDNMTINIQKRMELYKNASGDKSIKLFVNIGGASANYGNTTASITYPNGLVVSGPEIPDHPERGLIFEYQALGLPVIHLLNIRDLALKNGIPIDPIPLPEEGQSEVYFESKYQKWIIVITFIIGIMYLVLVGNINSRYK
ncbi:MAG TPA: poly-gamma-glutamate system protein, partial [Atribacterota bacterium]|nr:poly-gamma-glutamate system protein [Atribacterota bacterium]